MPNSGRSIWSALCRVPFVHCDRFTPIVFTGWHIELGETRIAGEQAQITGIIMSVSCWQRRSFSD